MKLSCTCIIPVHNEEKRVSNILSIATKVKEVDQIICVDDGSKDKSSSVIKKFPEVNLIQLSSNEGKSAAVAKGVEKAKGELILLLDADLVGITEQEISKAVQIMKEDKSVDMLLLRRSNASREVKLSRSETVITGDRIVYKNDLQEILKTNPKGYQLETAINIYMMKHKKTVYWFSCSTGNVMKREKFGRLKGLKAEISMHWSMLKFAGVPNYFKQFLFFGRHQYKNL